MIFALGILFLAGFASAAIPDDCDNNMVAYWQMEGDATDSFGSHDGVSSSWPNDGETFVSGGSAYFSGAEMISIPDGSMELDCGSNFAIEFWMKSSGSLSAYLLNKANYQIEYVMESPFKGHIDATVNGVTVSTEDSFIDKDEVYHVVLTWLGAGEDNLVLYVNNDLKDSATLLNPGYSSGDLEIGEGFVGLIDEVALYNRSFDADDVNFHYKTSGGGWDYCYTAGAGGVSSTRTDFTLAGCKIPGEDYSISAGSCSRDGMYYCGNISLKLYYTLGGHEILPGNTGCSLEKLTYEKGTPQCCPSYVVRMMKVESLYVI